MFLFAPRDELRKPEAVQCAERTLLREQGRGRTAEAIRPLHARESYTLALQSGRRADPSSIAEAVGGDIVLAAEFDANIRSQDPHPSLVASLEQCLTDHRLTNFEVMMKRLRLYCARLRARDITADFLIG